MSVLLAKIDWNDLSTQVVAAFVAVAIIFLLTLYWKQRRKISGLEDRLRICKDDCSTSKIGMEKAEVEADGLRRANSLYSHELQSYRDAEARKPPIPGARS